MTVERVCSFAQAVHLGPEIQTSQAMSVSRQSLCSLLGTTPNPREHLHEQMSYAIENRYILHDLSLATCSDMLSNISLQV